MEHDLAMFPPPHMPSLRAPSPGCKSHKLIDVSEGTTFFPPGLQWSLVGDFLTLSVAQGVSRPKSILALSSENKTRQNLPLTDPRLSEGHGSPAEFNPPLSTTPATAQQSLVYKSLTQQAGDSPVPRLKGVWTNWIS